MTFYNYRDILFPLLLVRVAQVLVLWMTAATFQVFLKVQSSKLNTKVCTVQVHLRKEPTRDWGVWLTCWSMHFISENIIVVAHFKSTRKNWQFTIWHLLLKEEGCTSPCTLIQATDYHCQKVFNLWMHCCHQLGELHLQSWPRCSRINMHGTSSPICHKSSHWCCPVNWTLIASPIFRRNPLEILCSNHTTV